MKTWKILTITTLTVAVAAVLLVSSVSAMGPWNWGNNLFGGNGGVGSMMGGYGGGMMGGYGGGMMGGYGYGNGYYPQQGTATPYQPIYPFQFGGGCHARGGYGAPAAPYTYTGVPLNITTATTIANNYIASIGNPDLTVKEIEEYTNNFYIQINEKSTGNGAFELLVDKYTGSIYPEMGPNMMWNTKYGMMRGGILGGIFGTPTTTMTVTVAQATTNAQQSLNSSIAGTTTGEVTTFYGYYTIEVLQNGNVYGMLSVNGYTGQVWFHNWHGTFIQEVEIS